MTVYRATATLPNDVARCVGVGSDEAGWRDGCVDCARRVCGSTGGIVPVTVPPPIIVFECELRIEPNGNVIGAESVGGASGGRSS